MAAKTKVFLKLQNKNICSSAQISFIVLNHLSFLSGRIENPSQQPSVDDLSQKFLKVLKGLHDGKVSQWFPDELNFPKKPRGTLKVAFQS